MGQFNLLNLSVTFCKYWICVHVNLCLISEVRWVVFAAGTMNAGASTQAALGGISKLVRWDLTIRVLQTISVPKLSVVLIAWASSNPAPSYCGVPSRNLIFAVCPPRKATLWLG